MTRLLVRGFTISLDGYGAGPEQSRENPLGVGGEELHNWLVSSRTFQQILGKEGGDSGIDNDFAARSMSGIGAWILGRNMFGPIRGEWPDESWRGWWGNNPPYHAPVFVLTHHQRPPLEMEGGTVFHFVTEGIEAALEQARAAAGAQDIRLLGGAATIRQYLQARFVDEMHLAVSPRLLGSGEHLLTGLDLPALGYKIAECIPSDKAVHYTLIKS
ncbi:dihydrofolate reductase family protein [Anatilimnocola floriformis]|uniref:dihydrofolate reductase family protein n=1 Tax=Anatilimnocola floriformis TaxID=2948575 RepID=UPI0020C27882|nr:dihydrofolate reductase family protein [Anatilimnocola floriformis]